MDIKEYYNKALAFAVLDRTDAQQLANSILGLCGESGELADMYKKLMFHGHNVTIADFADELGDVFWYLMLACYGLKVDPAEVLQRNLDKLTRRYPSGFSSEASINRTEYLTSQEK